MTVTAAAFVKRSIAADRTLTHSPAATRSHPRPFLVILAFGDMCVPFQQPLDKTYVMWRSFHLGVTLLRTPSEIAWDLTRWSGLLAGNVLVPAGLFVVRCARRDPTFAPSPCHPRLHCCGSQKMDGSTTRLCPCSRRRPKPSERVAPARCVKPGARTSPFSSKLPRYSPRWITCVSSLRSSIHMTESGTSSRASTERKRTCCIVPRSR